METPAALLLGVLSVTGAAVAGMVAVEGAGAVTVVGTATSVEVGAVGVETAAGVTAGSFGIARCCAPSMKRAVVTTAVTTRAGMPYPQMRRTSRPRF